MGRRLDFDLLPPGRIVAYVQSLREQYGDKAKDVIARIRHARATT
jgi:hypothetical protein